MLNTKCDVPGLADAAQGIAGRFVREEKGQAVTEYAPILAFVAIVAIAVLTAIGDDVSSLLTSVIHTF